MSPTSIRNFQLCSPAVVRIDPHSQNTRRRWKKRILVRRVSVSMAEMPHAGEHHSDVVVVGGPDHVGVAHRAAGLDHGGGAGLDGDQKAVGEGKEGVGGNDRSLGEPATAS